MTATAQRPVMKFVCPVCEDSVVMYVPAKAAWCSKDRNGMPHAATVMVVKK